MKTERANAIASIIVWYLVLMYASVRTIETEGGLQTGVHLVLLVLSVLGIRTWTNDLRAYNRREKPNAYRKEP